MSDKTDQGTDTSGRRFFKKLSPYMNPEGTFVSEALWSKGVLDTAARAL